MNHGVEPPGAVPAEDRWLRLCMRTGRLLYNWLARRLAAIGLTPVQYEVLDFLSPRREGATLSELRRSLCCAGSNVTAVVDRMERDGLLERRADASDRRVKRVRLTPTGRRRLREATSPACCPELSGLLNSADGVQLTSLLQTLVETLNLEDGGQGRRGQTPGHGRAGGAGRKPGVRSSKGTGRVPAAKEAREPR